MDGRNRVLHWRSAQDIGLPRHKLQGQESDGQGTEEVRCTHDVVQHFGVTLPEARERLQAKRWLVQGAQRCASNHVPSGHSRRSTLHQGRTPRDLLLTLKMTNTLSYRRGRQ